MPLGSQPSFSRSTGGTKLRRVTLVTSLLRSFGRPGLRSVRFIMKLTRNNGPLAMVRAPCLVANQKDAQYTCSKVWSLII